MARPGHGSGPTDMLFEFVLSIFVLLPDDTEIVRRIETEKAQATMVACNKLKLKPDNQDIVLVYEKFSRGVATLVCVAVPKKTEV